MTSARCLEIVGLPGSGKTTLASRLQDRLPEVRLRPHPDLKDIRQFPSLVRNGLSVAPGFASLAFGRRGRFPKRAEFLWMTFLSGWPRALGRPGANAAWTILDQGPVYMLSELIYSRETAMTRLLAGPRWRRTFEAWGGILKGILVLEASDEVLFSRVTSRAKDHGIKGATFAWTQGFLDRQRRVLEQALALLSAGRHAPPVVRVDAGRFSPDDIARKAISEFGLDKPTNRRDE